MFKAGVVEFWAPLGYSPSRGYAFEGGATDFVPPRVLDLVERALGADAVVPFERAHRRFRASLGQEVLERIERRHFPLGPGGPWSADTQ